MDEFTCRFGKSSNLSLQAFVKSAIQRKPITEIFPPNTFVDYLFTILEDNGNDSSQENDLFSQHSDEDTLNSASNLDASANLGPDIDVINNSSGLDSGPDPEFGTEQTLSADDAQSIEERSKKDPPQTIVRVPAKICLTLNSVDQDYQDLDNLRENDFPIYNMTIDAKEIFYSFMLNSKILVNPSYIEITKSMGSPVHIVLEPLQTNE